MMRLATVLLVLLGGCATTHNVNVAPLEVQPIRVTMDVNVNVHESDTPVGRAAEERDDEGAEEDRQQPSSGDER
jgi:hypothetical protein